MRGIIAQRGYGTFSYILSNAFTSKANHCAHVAEHVAKGDRRQALDVVYRQPRSLTEPEQPQGQDKDRANDQLGLGNSPRQGNPV